VKFVFIADTLVGCTVVTVWATAQAQIVLRSSIRFMVVFRERRIELRERDSGYSWGFYGTND
jgi:hypothetical protein